MNSKFISFSKHFLAILFAVAVTVAIFAFREKIQEFAVYGYVGIFVISLIGNATLILPAPSYAVVMSSGGALNPYLVGVVAGIGAGLGELTGYLAGYGGSFLVTKHFDGFKSLIEKWGAKFIFFLALIPNPFFDVGGILAGTIKMPLGKFLSAAILGKSLRFIILAMSGAYIFSLLGK